MQRVAPPRPELLNGIGVPAAMMAPLMSCLDGVTQHAVDLPAFGLTDTTPAFADHLRANAVRFLIEVLDELGLDRPVIIANSLGSLWASWLAIEQPDRVAGLVHIGCPAIVLDIAGLILATEQLDHFDQTFLAMLNRLVRVRGSRPDLALTSAQLAAIKAPTLLVFAANDPMGGTDVGRRVADAMTDADLKLVDGGHAPWLHHADQIAPLVSAFLRRIDHSTEP